MLNILFLSELFYPHGGGAELATYLYAKLLREAKFNVNVLTNRFPGESEFSGNEGFTVYRLPLLKKGESVKYSVLKRFDVSSSSFMKKFMKWADIVYVPRFWFSAIPLAKAYGKSVITHLHDYSPVCALAVLYDSTKNEICQRKNYCSIPCIYRFERRSRSLLKSVESTFLNFSVWSFLKRLIGYSDAVVCVSEAHRKLITERAPNLAAKTQVVYNPLPHVPLEDIKGNDFGYFGGSNQLKGFTVLLDALHLLKKSMTIQVTKFDLSSGCVRFFGHSRIVFHGTLPETALKRLNNQIATVIAASVWPEPWPYVVTEALLGGKIVLASRIGGIPEQVEGCKGAFLFKAHNYHELAEIMNYVGALSKETIVELGLKNKEHFLKRFRNEKTSNGLVNLIDEIGA